MHVFSEAAAIELLDGMACVFLAMTAALRGRALGGNLAGVLVLGCISALSAALAREFLLHGQQGLQLVFAQLPSTALLGSLAGLLLAACAKKYGPKLFFFLDTLSMSLTACLATALAAPELGATGALALGVATGLAPGLIRDMALGDTAMFLDQPWYAASVILAALCAICVILVPAFWTLPGFFVTRLGEWAVMTGCLTGMAMRYWRGRL